MTNTCPSTLPYLYDGHSLPEYAFYFVIIFKYVSEKNFDTRSIPSSLCMPCSWTALLMQCLRINVSGQCPTVVRNALDNRRVE
ncbi:hypothetical protein SFRURICE_012700 [Spodoptera frugiperda]|nr:hypothetical protein SFRURICE_012700 [Spodoptera frugiperda]